VVKICKRQESQEVIPLARSFIAYSPVHFVGIEDVHFADGGRKGELMEWARLLAYITGTVNQELLLRNECLAAENVSGAKFAAIRAIALW
jgi:hypothetical protein